MEKSYTTEDYEGMSDSELETLKAQFISGGNYGDFRELCIAIGQNSEFEQERYGYAIAEREHSRREEEFLQREAETAHRESLEQMTRKQLVGLGLPILIKSLKERNYSNGFDPAIGCRTDRARRKAYADVLYNLIHEEEAVLA